MKCKAHYQGDRCRLEAGHVAETHEGAHSTWQTSDGTNVLLDTVQKRVKVASMRAHRWIMRRLLAELNFLKGRA
jgi:hypothetical protein